VSDACTWCGAAVGDGFRVASDEGRAAFCRLEHVVPWAIRGARWEPGAPPADVGECAWCGAPGRVLVVRSRGEHDVQDAFCGVDHLLAWAKAGGRYR
jgi:hypothetical protein